MEQELIKKFSILGPERFVNKTLDELKRLPLEILLNTNYDSDNPIRVNYIEFMNNKAITFSNIGNTWSIKPLNDEIKFIEYNNQRGGTLNFKWQDYDLNFEIK